MTSHYENHDQPPNIGIELTKVNLKLVQELHYARVDGKPNPDIQSTLEHAQPCGAPVACPIIGRGFTNLDPFWKAILIFQLLESGF